jgi:RNA polymerase sigma factor (sigma-70 family)
MASSQMSGVIQHLRRTVLLRDGAGQTDGQLLEDYLGRRNEAALAALVHRHGPMVWGVCRRVLRHYHDAEDAFQATFLVFVRKAASISSRELLANWLYGVAQQTALKARVTTAKRKERERQVTEMPEPAMAERGQWHDLQPLLEEELSRLPDKYRAVIVLCDLDGKTRKEAARQLACPEGTVAGRLARARAMLAKRLAQRGVVLSGGGLAAVLSQNVASAVVPPLVVSSTIKAASLLAAGRAAGVVTAKVAALTEGVVQAMFVTKIKSVLAVVLVVGLALAGAAGLLYQAQAGEQPMAKEEQPAAKKDQKTGEQSPAQSKQQPAKTDHERILGVWVIVNEDSKRKGEEWWIGGGTIRSNPNYWGYWYPITRYYRLDAGKDPKQIDLSGQANGPPVSKGIYVLDGDELRLCLGGKDDRPAAFPAKPKPGEVLILHRKKLGAEQPKAKEEQPAAKKVLTPDEAIKQMPKENVTVQFKVASVEMSGPILTFPVSYYIYLKDGGKFTATLGVGGFGDDAEQRAFKSLEDFKGKMVRVTGRVESSGNTFGMWVRANQIEVLKE